MSRGTSDGQQVWSAPRACTSDVISSRMHLATTSDMSLVVGSDRKLLILTVCEWDSATFGLLFLASQP